MRTLHLLNPLLLAASLGACTTPAHRVVDNPDSGRTQVEALPDSTPGERLKLAVNERFLMPLPELDNAPPEYPHAMLVKRLPPRILCLSLSIDADGAVTAATPMIEGEACAAGSLTEEPFIQAAIDAVRGWQFIPAARCVYPDNAPVGGACGLDGSHEEPQAISLAFRFRFEQVDGQGRVRID